jgi:putative transposase
MRVRRWSADYTPGGPGSSDLGVGSSSTWVMTGHKKYSTWSGSRGNRLSASSYPRHTPVHVVVGTHLSQPFFADVQLAEAVHSLVVDHQRTLATCLMPDHLHWLLDDASRMRRAVASFKSYSTRVAWNLGHRGKLWQRSHWDHVVRFETDVARLASYIVGNPVRSELVVDWREYPFSVLRSVD